MRKMFAKLKSYSAYFCAFLILAFAFLAVGLGTLGATATTGGSYELKTRGSSAVEPAIVFHLSDYREETEDGSSSSTTPLVVKHIYLNVGAIYAQEGAVATLRLGRAYSVTSSYPNYVEASIANFRQADQSAEDGKQTVAATENALWNWTEPFEIPEDGWRISSYQYYKLTARNCNVRINEIVFVGEKLDGNQGTGEYCVVPAEIYEGEQTELVYNSAAGETRAQALEEAKKLLDAQEIPASSQSSFYRYGQEEVSSLLMLEHFQEGNKYDPENIGYYFGDRSYNALGLDLLALGTAIFGVSPFGLRFFPMLASFGVLVAGYFLVKRLTRSDKAAFVFALLYALSNAAFALGHFGTPLTIGLFFFVLSLDLCHRFYAGGMKKASLGSAVPLALSGIFGAAAVCVNGAFVVPVAGVVALFVCGMFRQRAAMRYRLAKTEAEEAPVPAEGAQLAAEGEQPAAEGERSVPSEKAKVAAEYRYKNILAPVVFGLTLLLGLFVIALIAMVPASYAYMRVYDDPSAPANGIFGLAWKAFAAGFVGGTERTASTGSLFFYRLFQGTGGTYAVTLATFNFVALLCALAGVVYAAYRLVRIIMAKEIGKEQRKELRRICVPLAGIVLSLATAFFAQGALAFLLAAFVFAAALFGDAVRRYTEQEGKAGKVCRILCWVGLGLLIAGFALLLVFTFSVPLPASFMAKFFA